MGLERIKVRAPAKINLSLDITSVRDDGYHNVDMIMHSVSLYDFVTVVKRKDSKITVKASHGYVPSDKKNIAYKSAEIFFQSMNIDGGVDVYIEKNIPVCAGLAGGSADSAAVFHALDKLYETSLDMKRLAEIAEKAGADVPFCLAGGAARVSGIGEKIKKISAYEGLNVVIVKPIAGASTKKVYTLYDKSPSQIKVNTDAVERAMRNKNLSLLCENSENVLEPITSSFISNIKDIKAKLYNCGAKKAIMSGSGSATYGIFESEAEAQTAHSYLKRSYRQVFLCKCISDGVQKIE